MKRDRDYPLYNQKNHKRVFFCHLKKYKDLLYFESDLK